MDRTSLRGKHWILIAILVLVVIVVATALIGGGQHEKGPDKSMGRISSQTHQAAVL